MGRAGQLLAGQHGRGRSLEDAVARVRQAPGAQLDEIHSIPGVGRFTYVKDTEGNVFGMMEPDGSD